MNPFEVDKNIDHKVSPIPKFMTKIRIGEDRYLYTYPICDRCERPGICGDSPWCLRDE